MYNFFQSSEALLHFQNVEYSRFYLETCYKKTQLKNSLEKAYSNTETFLAYLQHGERCLKEARLVSPQIQPILLFYGLTSYIKACILTVDPSYPSSTSVLAHGLSARKRKKKAYTFFEDEVKIQKDGLFTHCLQTMFHVKQLNGDKWTMGELFLSIPDLIETTSFYKLSTPFVLIQEPIRSRYQFPEEILDRYHMTEKYFQTYCQSLCSFTLNWEDQKSLVFYLDDPNSLFSHSPFRYHTNNKKWYFPSKRNPFTNMPELAIHYALLYNLSMIARYDIEWWNDLFLYRSTKDFVFIIRFLQVTFEKIPFLLTSYLFKENTSSS
jgi:hypothetical protein